MSLSIDLLNTDCKENCENCPSQFPEPKVTSSNCLFFLTNILKAKDSIYKHDKDKAETRKCLALLLTTWLVDNWNCFSTKVKWDLFSFDYSLIQFVSIAETVSAVITFFFTKMWNCHKKCDNFMVYFVSYDDKLNTFGIVN